MASIDDFKGGCVRRGASADQHGLGVLPRAGSIRALTGGVHACRIFVAERRDALRCGAASSVSVGLWTAICAV
jgi:hypothetical protein